MSSDCLVVGHHETSLDELAVKLRPTMDKSGGYTEIETNSVRWRDGQLSHGELFNKLALEAYGIRTNLSPFNAPHAGAIFQANRLRGAGLAAHAINYVSPSMEELTVALLAYRPRSVALTTTFYVEESPINALARQIRAIAGDETTIILGGPYVTARTQSNGPVPPRGLSSSQADVFIRDSQGEQTLIELVQALRAPDSNPNRFSHIPNTVWPRSSGELQFAPRSLEANDLDAHRVDWSTFKQNLKPKVAFVRSARGCAFSCAFCNYPALSGGHVVASVSTTCDEIESLCKEGVRDIAFVDDTFNVPLPRFKNLLREIIHRKLPVRWTSFFRCSNADAEAFDLMAESGCQAVFLGIESGDPGILKLMNKAALPRSYARGIAELTTRGILTMGSFIIGFPGESPDSVMRTLDFLAENPTTYHNFQLYYHDVLAPVERMRGNFEIKGSGYSWSHPGMDWREASDWVRYAMSTKFASAPIPLYGFSIWSLPYFQSLGMSRESFKAFTDTAGQALRESIAGEVNYRRALEAFRVAIPEETAVAVQANLERTHND